MTWGDVLYRGGGYPPKNPGAAHRNTQIFPALRAEKCQILLALRAEHIPKNFPALRAENTPEKNFRRCAPKNYPLHSRGLWGLRRRPPVTVFFVIPWRCRFSFVKVQGGAGTRQGGIDR